MKADDYVLKFAEYLNDPRSVWKDVPNDAVIENPEFDATIGICFDLMKEIKELVIKRNAQSGHAIAAVVNEIRQKWQAVHRKLNRPGVDINTFDAVFKTEMQHLADAYFAYKNSQRRVLPGRK